MCADRPELTLREELHTIDAVIAEQGVAIFSNVLVAHELEAGVVVKAADLSSLGSGYYLVDRSDHPRKVRIEDFPARACSLRWGVKSG